eukprot:4501898-Ditylum_brightwellii.AAC.1
MVCTWTHVAVHRCAFSKIFCDVGMPSVKNVRFKPEVSRAVDNMCITRDSSDGDSKLHLKEKANF